MCHVSGPKIVKILKHEKSTQKSTFFHCLSQALQGRHTSKNETCFWPVFASKWTPWCLCIKTCVHKITYLQNWRKMTLYHVFAPCHHYHAPVNKRKITQKVLKNRSIFHDLTCVSQALQGRVTCETTHKTSIFGHFVLFHVFHHIFQAIMRTCVVKNPSQVEKKHVYLLVFWKWEVGSSPS